MKTFYSYYKLVSTIKLNQIVRIKKNKVFWLDLGLNKKLRRLYNSLSLFFRGFNNKDVLRLRYISMETNFFPKQCQSGVYKWIYYICFQVLSLRYVSKKSSKRESYEPPCQPLKVIKFLNILYF